MKREQRVAFCERRVQYLTYCVADKKGTCYEKQYAKQLRMWQRKLEVARQALAGHGPTEGATA